MRVKDVRAEAAALDEYGFVPGAVGGDSVDPWSTGAASGGTTSIWWIQSRQYNTIRKANARNMVEEVEVVVCDPENQRERDRDSRALGYKLRQAVDSNHDETRSAES